MKSGIVKRTVFLALMSAMAFSYRQTPGIPPEALQYVRRWMDSSAIPGLAICVSRNGEIVWAEGFGFADLEQRVPVDPGRTRFRAGSISKSFTAAGLGILMDQEKIDLDTPVQDYVPYYPVKKYPVTTRQVAGHLAGIRSYKGGEIYSAVRYKTVREGLAIFMNDTLLFEPGTDYLYSTYGYGLVSAVIEGASGTDFLSFMHENIFDPLGMDATVEDLTDSIIPDRSGSYTKYRGNIRNAPYVDNSCKWAGGGFLSSAEDLVKFGNAMLNDTLLSGGTIRELTTSQKTAEGKDTGYGIGFSCGVTESGMIWFGHDGKFVGGTSSLTIYPREKVVVAIVSNVTGANFEGRHELAASFMKQVETP